MASDSAKKLATSRRRTWLLRLRPIDESWSLGGRILSSVVLDANVWYSAIVYGGKPELVVTYCLANFRVVMSPPLIDELIEKLGTKTKAPYRWLRHMRLSLDRQCMVVELPEDLPQIVRDPKDNHVIAVALLTKSSTIITGDKDLLDLKQYRGIDIVTSADFIDNVVC